MTDASRRKFDVVLVWKLDRFGRSLRHLVNAIAELEAIGVAFISFRDNLDLTTPSGRLMFWKRRQFSVEQANWGLLGSRLVGHFLIRLHRAEGAVAIPVLGFDSRAPIPMIIAISFG
jgi:Resolvase, N terminal domain